MSTTPRLAIITVVLNGEDFIAACLQNVIDQKCPGAEHLIIDGGSTDRTQEIIKSFAARYPHIRFFVENGLSQSDSMNKGIAEAKGPIIGFLNDDDYYEPHVLRKILDLFEKLPEPTFLVGNCNIRDKNDQITAVNKPRHLKLRDLLIGNQFCPHPINPSAYFYHKSLHQLTGPYRTDEEFAMDLDFILNAVRHAPAKYIDETWGNFRFIPGTKTYADSSSHDAAKRELRILERHFGFLTKGEKVYVRFFRCYFQFQLRQQKRLKNIFGDHHAAHADRRSPSLKKRVFL